jgi:hypothetical protein
MMTLQDTRILITVQVIDDTRSFAMALGFVIGLFTLVSDIAEAVTFTAKVFAIAFNSLAFGLGVSL